MPTNHKKTIQNVYDSLLTFYGPHDKWWPSDTRFEVILGAILTQRTSWLNAERALKNLKVYGTTNPSTLDSLPEEKLQELIYPAGFFRLKARRIKTICKFILKNFDGNIENMKTIPLNELRLYLIGLNGIGPETADAIALYCLEKPTFVIDEYTKRLFLRIGVSPYGNHYEDWQNFFITSTNSDTAFYQQYHALIVEHCKQMCSRTPLCHKCPINKICDYYRDNFAIL